MTRWLRQWTRPQRRRRLAAVLVVASVVGWPATALTVARNEPQIVLALSWLALTLTALDILLTTGVRAEQDDAS